MRLSVCQRPSASGAAVFVTALLVTACAETTPSAVPPLSPERMKDGVSPAESAAVIEKLGGWPPPRAGQAAPAVQNPAPERCNATDVDVQNARLDSLERVIVATQDHQQRWYAVKALGEAGLMSSTERVCVGVVRRLAALYPRYDDAQSLITALMINQTERTEAVAFLERVARTAGDPKGASRAVSALSRMGRPGRAAIRRLQADSVRR
jgi:hypothetical protein